MTIEQHLQSAADNDNQQQEVIKVRCVELAKKIISNEELTQDDLRDRAAFQITIENYIQQATYLEQIASNQQVN
jgi:hypothetical protein